MKIKLNKVDVKKQRLKAILCIALAAVSFIVICILGAVPLSVVLFLVLCFSLYEGAVSVIALLVGLGQERRAKCCEEKEQS